MSIENAKGFVGRMKDDEDFRKSVGEPGTAEERMAYVKKAGFEFTIGELEEVSTELRDDELNHVSGGSPDITHLVEIIQDGSLPTSAGKIYTTNLK